MLMRLVFAMLAASTAAFAAVPGQPHAGLWHLKDADPGYILNYNISTDPDAPFMRSGEPTQWWVSMAAMPAGSALRQLYVPGADNDRAERLRDQ